MGNNTVFKTGSIKQASEQIANLEGPKKRASGPALENTMLNRFESVNFERIKRAFKKQYNIPEMELPVDELDIGDNDGTIDMDSIINSALAKHQKRVQQNFLFDRIRAISSETQRINANIDLGNKPS